MAGETLFNITVTFALVTGTAAGLLSLLSWEIFRHSPFGRVIFYLSSFMSVFILYHVVLLVLQTEPSGAKLLWSAGHTVLVVVILVMARAHFRLSNGREVAES